jgi:hypothetical protein
MPSSAIHVLWLCRRPWGVSPSLTGSQQAREASSEGCCLPPGQCSSFVLWVTVVPSRRSLTARPQHGQWPVPTVLTRRGVPRPDGGVNGFPGTAGGHDATGLPGHAVESPRPGCLACRVLARTARRRRDGTLAGRSCYGGNGRSPGRRTRTAWCRRARRRRRIAAGCASLPRWSAVRRGRRGGQPARVAPSSCCGMSRPSAGAGKSDPGSREVATRR